VLFDGQTRLKALLLARGRTEVFYLVTDDDDAFTGEAQAGFRRR